MMRTEVTKINAEKSWKLEKRKEKVAEKKQVHFRPGMCALTEIHKFQKSSDLLIRRLPFVRYYLKYNLMQ